MFEEVMEKVKKHIEGLEQRCVTLEKMLAAVSDREKSLIQQSADYARQMLVWQGAFGGTPAELESINKLLDSELGHRSGKTIYERLTEYVGKLHWLEGEEKHLREALVKANEEGSRLRKVVADLNNQALKTNAEVGRLNGVVGENERQISQLTDELKKALWPDILKKDLEAALAAQGEARVALGAAHSEVVAVKKATDGFRRACAAAHEYLDRIGVPASPEEDFVQMLTGRIAWLARQNVKYNLGHKESVPTQWFKEFKEKHHYVPDSSVQQLLERSEDVFEGMKLAISDCRSRRDAEFLVVEQARKLLGALDHETFLQCAARVAAELAKK